MGRRDEEGSGERGKGINMRREDKRDGGVEWEGEVKREVGKGERG